MFELAVPGVLAGMRTQVCRASSDSVGEHAVVSGPAILAVTPPQARVMSSGRAACLASAAPCERGTLCGVVPCACARRAGKWH